MIWLHSVCEETNKILYFFIVSIGYNPYVVLTQYDLEDMLDKSKGRPKYFALRLAEKLFGIDVLIKSTPYGIGGKAALHPVILDAIKGILILIYCV